MVNSGWLQQKQKNKTFALVLVMTLFITAWSLSSYLWDKYQVVRDTQNFYWMARAQDPTLFARDYLYISSNYIIQIDILDYHFLLYPLSPGYGLFFYLASTVIDYIWLTKLSTLALVLISVIFLFKTGQFLKDDLTGASLSLIFIFFAMASPLSTSIVSGLQRAYSIPLLILFIYFLLRQKYVWAALLIFLSALIYLPNFPPMVLAYGFSIIKFKHPLKLLPGLRPGALWPFAISLLFSAMIVALALAVQLDLISKSSPAIFETDAQTTLQVSENPAYQSGGSMALFIGFPFLGRAGIFDTGGDVTNFLVMLTFGFLIYKTVGVQSWRRIPRELWWLLLAGFVMYAISFFFVFGLSSLALYLPSRYTRSTIFLFMLFFIGLNWVDFLAIFPVWLRKNIRLFIFFVFTLSVALGTVYVLSPNRGLLIPTFWFLGVILSGVLALLGGSVLFWLVWQNSTLSPLARWGAAVMLGVGVIFLGSVYIKILGVKTTNPSQAERAVYEYIATLPKDTVLAGNPDIMTNIPLFSKRSVLFRELFPRPNAPILQYFDAQYAETPDVMFNFCQRYQIDYLVLNLHDFSPDYLAKENFFYQPWNDQIVSTVTGRSNFAMLRVQPIFTSSPYAVIKCDAGTLLADKLD